MNIRKGEKYWGKNHAEKKEFNLNSCKSAPLDLDVELKKFKCMFEGV